MKKMANESISQLIALIVSLTVAVAIGGVIMENADVLSGSIQRKGSNLSQQIETDIKIINDPQYVTENIGGENVVILYVKNTGTETLDNRKDLIDILIDGEYLGRENITSLQTGDEKWDPSDVLTIVTDYTESYLGPGDHEVKIVIYNKKDSLKFRL